MTGPFAILEAARRLAEPDELVKFTLIYDGDLPSAGNKSKPIEASHIRNVFHDQLADLWDSHVILRQLARTARIWEGTIYDGTRHRQMPGKLPDYTDPIRPPNRDLFPATPYEVDLCEPIAIPNVGGFVPLVRNSLHLSCFVDVLFLRHEEPFSLMRQGGDLDGRLKTLFDGLKMPNPKDEYKGHAPTADPLYVVLEDDALISDFSVKSGRLLGRGEKKKHAVRLTVDITIKVLRVCDQNQCLIGG
jgi:hypothetical protein